ncbi:MAG: phosphatase [Marinilabiliaceae bacterium]|nr:phosphatase [Marinilabiliaceae bacterium]
MEKTRVAIIDLGTNTFNLLVTEIQGDNYRILTETHYPAKLGKGGIHKSTITEEAIERGIEALTTLLITISEYQVESIFCYATSAIRSAANGESFVKRVQEEFGLTIRVIPGDEEAEAIYDGVKQVVRIGNDPVLIMDIGGGSVEFIIANKTGILWKNSFDIGLARLIEQFHPSEIIRISEIEQIEDHLDKNCATLFAAVKKFTIRRLVGSSGSFETLAAMIAKANYPFLDLSKVSSFKIEFDELEDIHNLLITTNSDGRKMIPGMDLDRVENMVLASVMVQWALKRLAPAELIQSSFALKEGSVLQIIKREL